MTEIVTLTAVTGWAQAAAMIALVATAACNKPPARSTMPPADTTTGAPEDAVARPPDAAVARCGSSPGPALAPGRTTGAAAVLPDGTILLGGASTLGGWSAILDPASGTMTDVVVPGATAAIRMVRAGDTIVMLGSPDGLDPATAAARFDPQARRWSKPTSVPPCSTADLAGSGGHFPVTVEPVALADGTVLMVGHRCAAILRADGRWVETAPPLGPRRGFTLTRLRDGEVLRVGGVVTVGGDIGLEASTVVDRFDTKQQLWVTAASAHYMRYGHATARLADGRVLVVGGCEDSGAICREPAPPPEIYEPARDRWTALGSGPVTDRESPTLTALPDGRALVLAGVTDDGGMNPPSAIYDHGRWFALPPLAQPRAGRVAVLAGDHVLLGGRLTQASEPVLEWYGVAADCPATPVELAPARPPVGGSYP